MRSHIDYLPADFLNTIGHQMDGAAARTLKALS